MSRIDKVHIKKPRRAWQAYAPQEPAPQVDARIALNRMRNLVSLFNACGRDEERLAEFLLLPLRRVRGMLDGEVMISNELAMHIESQAELPGGWFDEPSPVIPDAVLARARGAATEPLANQVASATVDAPGPTPEAATESQPATDTQAKQEIKDDVHPAPSEQIGTAVAPKKRKLVSKSGKHIGRPFTVSLETAEARRHSLLEALDKRGKGARLALAREIGVGISVVSSWLSGRRRITDHWAAKIAKAIPEADMHLKVSPPQQSVQPQQSEMPAVVATEQSAPTDAVSQTHEDELTTLRDLCVRAISKQRDPAKLARILADIL